MRKIEVVDLVLAGAIFTEGEMKVIFAAFVAMALVAAIALAFFVRSLFRLVFGTEKSRVDVVVVATGVLLFVVPFTANRMADFKQRLDEAPIRENAHEAIQSASLLPDQRFEDGHLWWFSSSCETWVVPVSGFSLGFSEDPATVNEFVRSEAEAFEAAGWNVTRFAPNDSVRGTLAFRAERDDQILALREEVGNLDYLSIPPSCEKDPAKLDLWGSAVESF